MGGVISAKFLLVLVIALVVLGPEKLPDAARTLGRLIAEFRRITSGLQAEVREAFDSSELAGPISDLASPIQEWRTTTQSLRGQATSWLTGASGTAYAPSPAAAASPGGATEAAGTPAAPAVTGAARAAVSPAIGGYRGPGTGDLGIPPGDPSLN